MPSQFVKYNTSWEKEFKWLTKSNRAKEADYYGFCKLCSKNIKISHGGKYDIAEHAKSNAHKQNALASAGNHHMELFFKKQDDTLEFAAMEATQTYHMLQENQSFASMECQSKILNSVYKVPQFKCSSTKAAAIVEKVFLPIVTTYIQSELDTVHFVSVSTDASNHKATKMYPVLFRYFLPLEGIKTRLVDFNELPGETGEIIFSMIKKTCCDYNVQKKIIAYSADRAPVNFGGQKCVNGEKNVFTRMQLEYGDGIIGIGCLMHTLNSGLKEGCSCVLPIDLEVVVYQIYDHFYDSTKQTEALKDWCAQKHIEYHKMSGYGKTRFIGMKSCINSILRIFGALESYFNSKSTKKVPRNIVNFFANPLKKFLLVFVRDVTDLFETTILKIEGDKITGTQAVQEVEILLRQLKRHIAHRFVSFAADRELDSIIDEIDRDEVIDTIILPFYGEFSFYFIFV